MFDPGEFISTLRDLLTAVREIRAGLDIGLRLEQTLAGWVAGPVRGSVGFIVSTTSAQSGGAFTDDQTIVKWEPMVQLLATSALVAVMVWAFYRVMFAHGNFTQYTLRILLPRFLVALVVIQFCRPLIQGAVDLNNRLSEAIIAISLNLDFRSVVEQWLKEVSPEPGTGPIIAGALLIAFLLLVFVYVIRYALLVLLVILAPLAVLLLILPETKRYAHEWGSLFITTLLMQPLQLLILGVGLSLEAHGSSPLRHGFTLAALWMCFKVPGALRTASSVGSHAESVVHRHAAQMVKAAAKLAAAA